jgi:hypothetical protein
MYHPPSKRRQLLMRIATYGLMTIAVVSLVGVSLLYILGYRFDEKDRKVEQSGLVQYVSAPSGATVEVDGTALTSKTPAKSIMLPGKHEFVMWRDGYETWRKSLDITAGTLTWLNYTRLVPKERPVKSVENLPKLAGALASPNDKYIATLPDASQPTITTYDITGDEVKHSTFTLSSADYSDATTAGVAHRFDMIEWDKDGRYLLLTHTYNDKTEWLVIDRQANKLISNVTQTMDIAISSAHFADTSGSLLYALIDNSVRKINISGETVSSPLVSNVSEFHLHDTNTISYVSVPNQTTGHRDVGVVKDGKKAVNIYSSVASDTTPLHVVAGRYFGKDYLVMSEGKKVTVWNGTFPESSSDAGALQKMTTFNFKDEVASLQLSPEDRFILVENGSDFMSYDLERKSLSHVVQQAGTSTPRPLQWLDEYYVWSDRSDALTIREFDGTNEHMINNVVSGFDATLSDDGKYLYSIGKTETGFQLQRVRMILS